MFGEGLPEGILDPCEIESQLGAVSTAGSVAVRARFLITCSASTRRLLCSSCRPVQQYRKLQEQEMIFA